MVLMALVAALAAALLAPAATVAAAAELTGAEVSARAAQLAFPRGERAQSVWASGACWSECGSYCAWGSAACLAGDSDTRKTQGQCLKLTDTCDRYCQRQCRGSGGPLLPLDF
ncbi:MAG TPA: hypothetical protein VGC36_17295 [Rhizomicrobium sp.]